MRRKKMNYHSEMPNDAAHASEKGDERVLLNLDVKDFKKRVRLIWKGTFRPLYDIKCKKGRVAYVGNYKGKRIIPVFQKWNNRITTILPPWMEDGVNVEDCAITSLGKEAKGALDSIKIEKGRQTPPLN